MPATKERRIEFRLTAEQDELLREAAAVAGPSLTSFVVEAALSHARAVLAEHHTLELAGEAFDKLVESLDDDRPILELVEVFRAPMPDL